MILDGAVSFRAGSAVVELLHQFLPQFRAAPAPNTMQSWLLRLGLHELQRPKEEADDWILLMDHTMQLGSWKCLLIVGLRQSAWMRLERPLEHHDLTVITLEPVKKSDGELVYQQLEAVTEQIGVPLAILNDGGSDLTNGAAKFKEQHPETRLLNDLAHKAALLLKRELLADPRWDAFAKHCGQAQPKVKQTELAQLAPPTQKIKARYMNLGPLIAWGVRMLRLVDTPAAERPTDQDLSRLDEKFGWICDFREALEDWSDLQAVKDLALQYGRVEGYHPRAAEELSAQLVAVARREAGQRLATSLVGVFTEQSQAMKLDQALPASSEVLESLIGKGKRLQGQHSRGGFTKMILGMAASVVEITHERISEALEAVRNIDLATWRQEKLGPSLAAQRRQALPVATGTKTGQTQLSPNN
jgi:hypothetical protein